MITNHQRLQARLARAFHWDEKMPLPSSINDLSTTAGSNSPAGSESPSLIDDYLRTYASYIAQLRDGAQSNAFNFATAGGSANAITATYSPAITTLSDSTVLLAKAAAVNTGAATFSPNGLTAKPIVDLWHGALQGGEIVANGEICLQYNSSVGGGSWILIYSSGIPQQAPAIVGSSLNIRMNIAAASASGTLTADEVVVKSALGSYARTISNFNKTINLATTGAGGMDTGTAPVSGFVALYAIYNPGTATAALLATNATSAAAPAVYGGANMPSGYTLSALLTVYPTNASSQFIVGAVEGAKVIFGPVITATQGSNNGSYTAQSLSAVVPKNARKVGGYVIHSASSSGSVVSSFLASASSGVGEKVLGGGSVTTNSGYNQAFEDLTIITAQTIYFKNSSSIAGQSFTPFISSYYI
ncbi:hypothetical protein [Pseudomonas kribbensis]|uniref:Uncharacterized protein n=1 Tax=Pseudomonas kribbensis TaxID=1628086 RepID=A0A4Y8VMQ9_9PSED|nr:hypothetical protein [Pseudomonas kribbensis]TFH81814.1 hypothetical protein E4J90_09560 [Pseudomonas kribbensis]